MLPSSGAKKKPPGGGPFEIFFSSLDQRITESPELVTSEVLAVAKALMIELQRPPA